jgi:hypothetical protein
LPLSSRLIGYFTPRGVVEMCQLSHKDGVINHVICLIFHLILMAIGVINPTFS